MTFKPNRVQRIRLDQFKEYCDADWNIVKPIRHFTLKYRQGGVSTMDLLWWLDETLFNYNTITAVQAHKQESLRYLIEILKLAYEELHDDAKPEIDKDSTHEMSFPGIGSKIFVSLSVRSTAVHNLHISEWCLTEDDRVRASLGSVGPAGNVTGESTGHGVGNDGYQTFMDARSGSGPFKALFLPWYLQDEYKLDTPAITRTREEDKLAQSAKAWGVDLSDGQIAFRRAKRRELRELMPQEFPETADEAFLASGRPFFDNRKLMALLKDAREHEGKELRTDDDWTMWHDRQPGHVYAAGVDTADEGGDWSVIKIIDVTDRKEAFRYRARISPDKLARECNRWGTYYYNALLGVEANNHGHAVLLALQQIHKYKNLYSRKRKVNSIRKGQKKDSPKPGWLTDSVTRPLMLDMLKTALEGDPDDGPEQFAPEFEVYDTVFLAEGLSFSENRGKFEAQAGHHDDCVIATAIALQMYLEKAKSRDGSSTPGKIIFGKKLEAT